MCVRCTEVASVRSKVLSSLFEGSSKTTRPRENRGPTMWDWLPHIDSAVWDCVCVFLSHICACPFPRFVQSAFHLSCQRTLCPPAFTARTALILLRPTHRSCYSMLCVCIYWFVMSFSTFFVCTGFRLHAPVNFSPLHNSQVSKQIAVHAIWLWFDFIFQISYFTEGGRK